MARPSTFDRGEALAKARNLFWRKGYHATSLKDLEAELSLKPGSIYGAFGNKEALYLESLDLYMRESQAEFDEMRSSAPSALSALAGYVRSFADCRTTGVPSNACMVVKTILETSKEGPDGLAEAAETHFRNMADLFESMFDKAKSDGEVPPDLNAHRAAVKLQASLTGLRAMADSRHTDEDLFALADDLAQEIEGLRLPSVA